MALRFLPDALAEQEEDHQEQQSATGGDARRRRLLVVDRTLDVALQRAELAFEILGGDLRVWFVAIVRAPTSVPC